MLIRYLIIFMFWWFKCIVNRNLIRIKCYWWNNLIYKLYDLDIKLKTVYILIYVSREGNKILIIDRVDGKLENLFQGPTEGNCFVLDKSCKHILIANFDENRIINYTFDGEQAYIHELVDFPKGFAFQLDREGSIFFVDTQNAIVFRWYDTK